MADDEDADASMLLYIFTAKQHKKRTIGHFPEILGSHYLEYEGLGLWNSKDV